MKKLILGVTLATTLVGCGGSGGDDSGSTNTDTNYSKPIVETQYPVLSVIKKISVEGFQQHLYANYQGSDIELIMSTAPKGNAQFNNKSVKVVELTSITKVDGVVTGTNTHNNYFTSPFRLEGSKDGDGEVGIVTEFGNVPDVSKTGSIGALFVKNAYANSTRTMINSTDTATWSLEDSSNSTADLCINAKTEYKYDHKDDMSASECYTINKSGDIVSSHATIAMPNGNGFDFIKFKRR